MKRRTAELSADDLQTLARSADEGLRVKAALHPHTPLATLLSLTTDQAIGVRRALARRMLERFRHDADASVRLVAETRLGLSLDTLRAFARQRSPSYRATAAASLPWNDPKMPALLADRHERVLLALLRRPDFPAAFYAQITDDPPLAVRLLLATHEALDAARLQRLLRDPRAEVRRRVAQRRALSAEQFEALANDDDWVKLELAKRPDCPEPWLRRWSRAPSESLRRAVFTHPGVTPDILATASALPANHREIANHPLTPEQILAQLADSADLFVRGAVAQNPSTPERVLSQLARDADSFVRLNVASNKACPLFLLLDLEHDPEFVVRRHVVWRADCPLDILKRRAADESAHVRYAVADHPQATAAVLSELARDEALFVRARAKARLSCS